MGYSTAVRRRGGRIPLIFRSSSEQNRGNFTTSKNSRVLVVLIYRADGIGLQNLVKCYRINVYDCGLSDFQLATKLINAVPLLINGMKVLERVLESRLKQQVKFDNMQLGFTRDRSP